MRFDRKKPGGGVEIHCRLENGKAWLGWKFHIQKDAAEPGGTAGNVTGVRAVQRAAGEGLTAGQSAPKSFTAKEGIAEGSVASKTVVPGKLPDETYRGACQVEVTVTDREGHLAAYGRKRLDEEEPLETLLLHPHSWSGMEDPYLYRVEACLLEPGGCPTDQVVLWLPLREVAMHPEKGVLLNGKAFLPRAVRYVPPCGEGAGAAKALQMEQMRQEFLLLKEMGANCIHYEAGKNGLYPYFLQLCDKYGFVVWEQKEGIPCRAAVPHPCTIMTGQSGAGNHLSIWHRKVSAGRRMAPSWLLSTATVPRWPCTRTDSSMAFYRVRRNLSSRRFQPDIPVSC